jgi:hypothetical protein
MLRSHRRASGPILRWIVLWRWLALSRWRSLVIFGDAIGRSSLMVWITHLLHANFKRVYAVSARKGRREGDLWVDAQHAGWSCRC